MHEDWNFTNAEFALQANIDPQIPMKAGRKIPLTISSDTSIEEPENGPETIEYENIGSRPDGWAGKHISTNR